jgi:long-chain acyl-CoA synthetase
MARLARVVDVTLGEVDLSLSQFRLLVLLSSEAAVASKLAEYLAVSPPSVTAVVDGLVARGLVERRVDTTDRRRVEHTLTVGGRHLLQVAEDAVQGRLARSLACLDRADAVRAAEGLRLWERALDADRSMRKSAGGGRRSGAVAATPR